MLTDAQWMRLEPLYRGELSSGNFTPEPISDVVLPTYFSSL